MIPLPQISELGSALSQVMLVAGIALVIPYLADPRRPLHRAILLGIGLLLGLRYMVWRGAETLAPFGPTLDMAASWSLFGFEILSFLGTLSATMILVGYRDRRPEADAHRGWWGAAAAPRVAVLIATYNEDLDILERTIIGARALDYPGKRVLVLDDGRRDWLRDYCGRRGVEYVRRDTNEGAKAGNINNALALLRAEATPPDFVAVLDADFVPHRDLLNRAMSLFHDDRVGIVQTPQHFFNADPIQNNLGLDRSYPDEQRFFFDHLQPSRDWWDMTICCGTSSVIRMQALDRIGGFPTDSVTEDFLLTLAFKEIGYSTAYLNEPLSEGLAPEGLKEFITQRARWCLGQMQIVRSRLGPFRRNGLSLVDRWSMIDSVVFWLGSFGFRVAAIVYPLLYWYANIHVVDAPLTEVIGYFGTYYLWTLVVLNYVSRGVVIPILLDVSQLVGAVPIVRAAATGLLRPKGHPFSVTAKGGDRTRVVVQWRLMAPFAVLFALTVVGLTLGIVSSRFAFGDAGEGKWVVLFWTVYNLVLLALAMIVCVELPREERHVADAPERTVLVLDGRARRIWVSGLTRTRLRLRGLVPPPGAEGAIALRDVGEVRVSVDRATEDGAVMVLHPTEDQREALYLRLHAEGGPPGVMQVSTEAVFGDMMRRLSAIGTLGRRGT